MTNKASTRDSCFSYAFDLNAALVAQGQFTSISLVKARSWNGREKESWRLLVDDHSLTFLRQSLFCVDALVVVFGWKDVGVDMLIKPSSSRCQWFINRVDCEENSVASLCEATRRLDKIRLIGEGIEVPRDQYHDQ